MIRRSTFILSSCLFALVVLAQKLVWNKQPGVPDGLAEPVRYCVHHSTEATAPLPWPRCAVTTNIFLPVMLCGGGPRRFFYVDLWSEHQTNAP